MRTNPRLIISSLAMLAFAVLASTPATAAPLRILALGDSLTQGYGLPPGVDFPVQLEKALRARGHEVVVVNGGVSGSTSSGGAAALDWKLAPDVKTRPDAVIVELGANDGLRGIPVTNMEANLDHILARLKKERIPTLLTGMKAPRNYGSAYAASFDAVFPRLAAKYGVIFYPFFLDGVALDRALNQPDLTHPNEKGVSEIVKRILPSAEKLVAQAKARKSR